MINDYEEDRDDQAENVKRSPAIEYGYDKQNTVINDCVDSLQTFYRTPCACYGKEI